MRVTVSRVKMAGFDGKAFSYDVYVKKPLTMLVHGTILVNRRTE